MTPKTSGASLKKPSRRSHLPTEPLAAPLPTTNALFERIVTILESARARVSRAVNSEMVLAYWHTGREIVEEVQRGEGRAAYGEAVIEGLSIDLTSRFGRGFSERNLKYFRSFYLAFSDRPAQIRQSSIAESRPVADGVSIPQARTAESNDALVTAISLPVVPGFAAELSWGHYRVLSAVAHPAARLFYEIEAVNARWSVDDLERQIHTQLFARLLKSRDRAGVMALATQGQALTRPADVLREPYVLDFLGLPDGQPLHESDLETAIISKLQHFLLELGKGFAFVARQKRLDYDDECFYVDLVFYNCILKFYLLIDLKTGKLTHQDVGQMDSYVRLFDDRYTTEGDNPTIGLILCAKKNEAVARYSVLNDSEQIFAARYLTYLPTVEELQRELQRERMLLESLQRRGGT